MKVIIEGTPYEIAVLVGLLQERHEEMKVDIDPELFARHFSEYIEKAEQNAYT